MTKFDSVYVVLLAILVLMIAGHSAAQEHGIRDPMLVGENGYSEYWEQQFLFGDDSFVTSQFLITNLPLSKHHGIQIATLTGPGTLDYGTRLIIKNGRPRSGWQYDAAAQTLSIFKHSLEGQHPGYLMRLHNKAAELDLLFSANGGSTIVVPPDNSLGLPAVTMYAPAARAFARWRPGPEIDSAGEGGAWTPLGHGHGFGLHVIEKEPANRTIRRWRRLTGTNGKKGQPVPVLHEFLTPKGELHTVLLLLSPFDPPMRFDTVSVSAVDDLSGIWTIEAASPGLKLSGQIMPGKKLDHFVLAEHLTGLEKLVAGSLSAITRMQSRAHYELVLKAAGTEQVLSGEAVAEEIVLGKEKSRRNRRLRR